MIENPSVFGVAQAHLPQMVLSAELNVQAMHSEKTPHLISPWAHMWMEKIWLQNMGKLWYQSSILIGYYIYIDRDL